MQTFKRLNFFDNLRVVLMVVVIAHHVGQAYGPTGGWWPIQEPTRAAVLEPFFAINRTFGMSLFFLIAGYFTAQSCDKRGPGALAKSRLLRLGIPLLVFSLLMVLLQVFVFGPLATGELGAAWPVNVIHLWFVQHLLLYSLGYALWRWLRIRRERATTFRPANPPGYGKILAFAFGMAVLIAIAQIWYDIDQWVYLLGYLRVAFVDVPRDLGMFIVGALAFRHQWVTRFPSRTGRVWLAVGLVLAGFWYVYLLWLPDVIVFSGLMGDLILALWEALLCCSMCIGLTVLFRDWLNAQGALAREMARSTYVAYIIHVFIAILIQYLALGLAAPPLLKFFLVTLVTVPVTFLLASLLRRPLRL